MNRDPSYLLDIAKFAQTIIQFTENMSEAEFESDRRTQLAVLYEITIIGEVVKRLSDEFRGQHPRIEWRQISGMRDRLVHDYDEVIISIIWQVVKHNIPELLAYITPLLPTEEY